MSRAKYLAVQNGAEEAGFVDLLTGGQNHFHLVMVAQSAGVVKVYSAQLLYTGGIIEERSNILMTGVDNCAFITIIIDCNVK